MKNKKIYHLIFGMCVVVMILGGILASVVNKRENSYKPEKEEEIKVLEKKDRESLGETPEEIAIKILEKKENKEILDDVINQMKKVAQIIKTDEDLDKIVVNESKDLDKGIDELWEYRQKIKGIEIKGVEIQKSKVFIKDSFVSLYEENEIIDEATYIDENICAPIYSSTQEGMTPSQITSLIKGGWSVDVTVPIEENNKKIGEFTLVLDVTNLEGMPKKGKPSNEFQSMAAKPVIYLYPEKKKDINVKLDYNGTFHTTYPPYNKEIHGWQVEAYPDGKIINKQDGLEYSYIFWDGFSEKLNPTFKEGYIIKGVDTKEFLQNVLPKMGLAPKEYNEFIVYWLPLMKENEYNVISFLEKEYTDIAKLDISPKPDSMLRVFMVYKSINEKEAAELKKTVKVPKLKPFERKGFAVIEWGGSRIN